MDPSLEWGIFCSLEVHHMRCGSGASMGQKPGASCTKVIATLNGYDEALAYKFQGGRSLS